MAALWATKIVEGKKTFAQVPRLLKDRVREILTDRGYADLIVEDDGE